MTRQWCTQRMGKGIGIGIDVYMNIPISDIPKTGYIYTYNYTLDYDH